jgi:hypothetical protein
MQFPRFPQRSERPTCLPKEGERSFPFKLRRAREFKVRNRMCVIGCRLYKRAIYPHTVIWQCVCCLCVCLISASHPCANKIKKKEGRREGDSKATLGIEGRVWLPSLSCCRPLLKLAWLQQQQQLLRYPFLIIFVTIQPSCR